MDVASRAIAHPTRRTILRLVRDDELPAGEHLELLPHERIVFSFGWGPTDEAPAIAPGSTRVEITLTDDGGDTIMTLPHTGIPAAHADEHRSGWADFLPLLADAASSPAKHEPQP